MARRKPHLAAATGPPGEPLAPPRIVGGRFRGRKLAYTGDPVTRPMKDRVREAVFNLVGAYCPGTHAYDLFAGTGAIGLEALSRGAERATFVERHLPTVRLLRENLGALGVADQSEVVPGDTFFWARHVPSETRPWAVFVSPPWDLFETRWDALDDLLTRWQSAAPPGSLLVVEANAQFDPRRLPRAEQFRVRDYPPARVCVWRAV